jgi:hypothetical protein
MKHLSLPVLRVLISTIVATKCLGPDENSVDIQDSATVFHNYWLIFARLANASLATPLAKQPIWNKQYRPLGVAQRHQHGGSQF